MLGVQKRVTSEPVRTAIQVPIDNGNRPANLTEIEKQWGAILGKVKLEKIRVGAILENAFPAEIVKDTLFVGFRNSDFTDFHAEIIHKEKEYLSQILKEFIARRLYIQCDLKRVSAPEKSPDAPSDVNGKEKGLDYFPSIESDVSPENRLQNETHAKDTTELFKYIRELEQKEPLKKMITQFDCELIEASYKSNT